MSRATSNGRLLAESDATIIVEGNHYFPPHSVDHSVLRLRPHESLLLEGHRRYKDVVVNGQVNTAAAWYYPDPSDAASHIAGYYAFWYGDQVHE